MPIRIINNNQSFKEAINSFDRDIKNFVLIEIVNKIFSFTLEYTNGKLSMCDSKQVNMEKAFNISSFGLPIEIPYVDTSVLIFGFVVKTPNGSQAFVTDLSMAERKVVVYTDRLDVLRLWGFDVASYLETDRKKILTDIPDVDIYKHLGKQIMIIPNRQTTTDVNNWPLMIK